MGDRAPSWLTAPLLVIVASYLTSVMVDHRFQRIERAVCRMNPAALDTLSIFPSCKRALSR